MHTLSTMLLRRTTLYTTLCHHSTTNPLYKIPHKHRPKAIHQAQQALTDHLHTVSLIPYTFAQNITNHSLTSLSTLISNLTFSTQTFHKSLQRFFRYNPVNEFQFFFESIGININEIDLFLPQRKLFLSQDLNLFNVACTLYGFGVPWNKLGVLYKAENLIFDKDPSELKEMWRKFMDLGFCNSCLVGICLVFPSVLMGGSEIEALVSDFKRVIVDFDLGSDLEGSVDSWIDICRKIKLFYDLGRERIKITDMIGGSKSVLVETPREILSEKVDYFCRFDVSKEEVVVLLLSRPEIFEFDLISPVFCVVGLLKYFGLDEERLNSVMEKHPYVLGRNRMTNLPHVLKSLDLNQWFFDKTKDGGHCLLNSYSIHNSNEDSDKEFAESLLRIQSSRLPNHTLSKLQFLHSIGYGENGFTLKVLKHIHGTSSQLQKRFDCLIHNGIGFSKLCKMISLSPKILNQQAESLERKVKFLCEDIGSPLQYLDVFPAYLCFDLEKRIKPRFRFHTWLTETGLCEREYSLASIIATSEISFIARSYRIHPAAPKVWLEVFTNPDYYGFQET